MAATIYCTSADVKAYANNANAFANVSSAEMDAGCAAASALADSKLRGRGQLPLTRWGIDITMNVAWIAGYLILSARGYNPAAGADPLIYQKYKDAINWFDGVQRQSVQPDCDFSPTPAPLYQLPQVHTHRPRGW